MCLRRAPVPSTTGWSDRRPCRRTHPAGTRPMRGYISTTIDPPPSATAFSRIEIRTRPSLTRMMTGNGRELAPLTRLQPLQLYGVCTDARGACCMQLAGGLSSASRVRDADTTTRLESKASAVTCMNGVYAAGLGTRGPHSGTRKERVTLSRETCHERQQTGQPTARGVWNFRNNLCVECSAVSCVRN